jgi:hypothetical protein
VRYPQPANVINGSQKGLLKFLENSIYIHFQESVKGFYEIELQKEGKQSRNGRNRDSVDSDMTGKSSGIRTTDGDDDSDEENKEEQGSPDSSDCISEIPPKYLFKLCVRKEDAACYYLFGKYYHKTLVVFVSTFPLFSFFHQLLDQLETASSFNSSSPSSSIISSLSLLSFYLEFPLLSLPNISYSFNYQNTSTTLISFNSSGSLQDEALDNMPLLYFTPNMMVLAWEALVLEKSVLVLSSNSSVLLPCCEFLKRLILPMQFSGSYFPVIPPNPEVFDIPGSFLLGAERKVFLDLDMSLPLNNEVIIIDLDKRQVFNSFQFQSMKEDQKQPQRSRSRSRSRGNSPSATENRKTFATEARKAVATTDNRETMFGENSSSSLSSRQYAPPHYLQKISTLIESAVQLPCDDLFLHHRSASVCQSTIMDNILTIFCNLTISLFDGTMACSNKSFYHNFPKQSIMRSNRCIDDHNEFADKVQHINDYLTSACHSRSSTTSHRYCATEVQITQPPTELEIAANQSFLLGLSSVENTHSILMSSAQRAHDSLSYEEKPNLGLVVGCVQLWKDGKLESKQPLHHTDPCWIELDSFSLNVYQFVDDFPVVVIAIDVIEHVSHVHHVEPDHCVFEIILKDSDSFLSNVTTSVSYRFTCIDEKSTNLWINAIESKMQAFQGIISSLRISEVDSAGTTRGRTMGRNNDDSYVAGAAAARRRTSSWYGFSEKYSLLPRNSYANDDGYAADNNEGFDPSRASAAGLKPRDFQESDPFSSQIEIDQFLNRFYLFRHTVRATSSGKLLLGESYLKEFEALSPGKNDKGTYGDLQRRSQPRQSVVSPSSSSPQPQRSHSMDRSEPGKYESMMRNYISSLDTSTFKLSLIQQDFFRDNNFDAELKRPPSHPASTPKGFSHTSSLKHVSMKTVSLQYNRCLLEMNSMIVQVSQVLFILVL